MNARNVVLLSCLATAVACLKEAPRRSSSLDTQSSAVSNPDAIGLNLGRIGPEECPDATSCDILENALYHAQTLQTRWVRLEIVKGGDPAYWETIVSRFTDPVGGINVNVLGLLDNTLWDVDGGDPGPCDRGPSDFGNRLVGEWLDIATPYVDRLRTRISNWEIWNEANNIGSNTYVCPGSYAYLLEQTARRWQDDAGWNVVIGTSTVNYGSMGDGGEPGSAREYLRTLNDETDSVESYRQDHGGNPPWDRVYAHAYPCHSTFCGVQGEAPDVFLPSQVADIRAVQPRQSIWFTELGFEDSDNQTDNLFASYNVLINRGLAEKVFWFSTHDCARSGNYGLIAGPPGCVFARDESIRRPSYWAFQSLSTNSLICHSITPCKYTSAAAGCDTTECPAIKFQTGWGQRLHETSYGYAGSECTGTPLYYTDDYLDVPSGGNWLIWVQLPFCPAHYSPNWSLPPCPGSFCGRDYQCMIPMPDCSSPGSPEPQALELGGPLAPVVEFKP